jgi:MoxR-like ATPase
VFGVGDYVRVTNSGSTYSGMTPKRIGESEERWTNAAVPVKSQIYEVIASKRMLGISSARIYVIDDGEHRYCIGEEGIELYKKGNKEEKMARKKTKVTKGELFKIVTDVSPYANEFTVGQTYEATGIFESGGTGYVTSLELTNNNGNGQHVLIEHVATVKKSEVAKRKKLSKVKVKPHEIIGQDHNKKMLNVAIDKNMPVLLIGETGTGKTSLIREQAIERKQPLSRFNLTGETTVDEFVGKYELEGGKTVWRDGLLLTAMKEGKWLVVDEINVALPEILFVLHSLLDDDKFVTVSNHLGEVVKPHKDFRFFGTMNPVDEYAGTKELNKAFQSRFNMILKVNYPDNVTEAKIVQDKAGVEEATANKMADVAVALRKAKADDKIFYTCSTRDLIQWGLLVEDLGLEDAFIVSVLNKANGDAKKIVEVYDSIVGKYIELEDQGYTLSIDWFESAAKKLVEAKKKFEDDKENTRKKITEEIVTKLTSGESSISTSEAGTIAKAASKSVTVEDTEVEVMPF